MAKTYPGMVDDIMDFESGQMDEERTIAFFQKLVDNGLAWTLQGSYGRAAQQLLNAGLIAYPHEKCHRAVCK